MLFENEISFFTDHSGLAIIEILQSCLNFLSLAILSILLILYLVLVTLYYYPKKLKYKNYSVESNENDNSLTKFLLYYSAFALWWLMSKQFLVPTVTPIYSYYLYKTSFTVFLEVLVLFTSGMIFWYLLISQDQDIYQNLDLIPSQILHRRTVIIPEIPYLFLFTVWFLLLLIQSNHLLITFIGLVGFSLSIYVLITIFPQTKQFIRPNWTARYEAGIKYFFLSTLSSSLVLLTAAKVFMLCQTNNLMEIQNWLFYQQNRSSLFLVAVISLLLGLAFKISAFPSQFWAPEVYQGSDDSVAAFILLPVKIAAFGVLLKLLVTCFSTFDFFWKYVVLAMSIGSMLLGAFGAFRVTKIKQFLAFSSINQVGFMLVGLATNTVPSIENTLLFLIVYVFTNVLFFLLFLQQKSFIFLAEISSSNLVTKLGWTIVFFSLAGIPPFAGFFAKFFILMEAFNVFDPVYRFTVLIGILTSLISAYYYLRFIKNLWFDPIKNNISTNKLTSIKDLINFGLEEILIFVEFLVFSEKATKFRYKKVNFLYVFVELILWCSSLIVLTWYYSLHNYLTAYCKCITKSLFFLNP